MFVSYIVYGRFITLQLNQISYVHGKSHTSDIQGSFLGRRVNWIVHVGSKLTTYLSLQYSKTG